MKILSNYCSVFTLELLQSQSQLMISLHSVVRVVNLSHLRHWVRIQEKTLAVVPPYETSQVVESLVTETHLS